MKTILPLIKLFLWVWVVIDVGATVWLWGVLGLKRAGLLTSIEFRGEWRDLVLPTMLLLLLIIGNLYALRSVSKRSLDWNSRLNRLLLFFGVNIFLTLWVLPPTGIYIDSFGLIVMIMIWIALVPVKNMMLPHDPIAPAGPKGTRLSQSQQYP